MLLLCLRLLRELQSEGALSAEQSLRVKEWLCSVEEERSSLTTASGPDSGIDNSSTEDSVALRRGRPTVRSQVRLFNHCSVINMDSPAHLCKCDLVPGCRRCRGAVEQRAGG